MGLSTRRSYLRRVSQAGSLLAAGALSGCQVNGEPQTAVADIRVASKPFAEQRILGYLAYGRLHGLEGAQVVNEIGYGDSLDNWLATVEGTKDLYWEYTGTAWLRLPPRREERITDRSRLYEHVRTDAKAAGITMGTPAPFSNEFVVVADKEWSEKTGVATMSDLVAHVNAGNADFGMAVGEDFYHREDGWRALSDYYGIDPAARTRLESRAIVTSIGLTYELLSEGQVAIASGFNTDPHLARDTIVVLEDDRGFFIPYQPAPAVHTPTADAHPNILDLLAPVASTLDEATMRQLNGRAVFDGENPRHIAQSHLRREGLLP